MEPPAFSKRLILPPSNIKMSTYYEFDLYRVHRRRATLSRERTGHGTFCKLNVLCALQLSESSDRGFMEYPLQRDNFDDSSEKSCGIGGT